MSLAMLLICFSLLYVRVIVIKGFNTATVFSDRHEIKLIPESRQNFGGLGWGLLRFDLEDRLDVGVSANVGVDRDLTMRLEKDGHILVSTCRSDQSGTCYGLFRSDEIKMSGYFCLEVKDGDLKKTIYKGKFVRQSRLVLTLRELMLSA